MHMNEHGITLQHDEYKGRLIRPTRYYREGNDAPFWEEYYTNAMYSYDGGKTWPVKRLIDEVSFAYSSMAAGRAGTESEGTVYLLYESDGGAKMARFNLAWLTNGVDWKQYVSE